MQINGYFLDEDQLKPILENPKYSLIIAGAGSGKTTVLIGKIKYLIKKKNISPKEIVCITFTNKAVQNLKDVLQKNHLPPVECVTFHKLALNILKENKEQYQLTSETLLQETIEEFFASDFFENPHFSRKKFKNQTLSSYQKTLYTFLSLFRNHLYQPEDFYRLAKIKKYRNSILLIYAIYLFYETEKQSTHSLDFEDMILLATKRIQEKKVVLPYQYILIDEFQDSSLLRFQFIKEIVSQKNASLCVVGDDYQSIYHFSGCDLEIFLNFSKYYPSAKIYKLEETYRNSEELITIAGKFIQKNPTQISKTLFSKKHLLKPIILVYTNHLPKAFAKILEEIPQENQILCLGRHHFEKETIKEFLNDRISFSTIHAAKGLESDVVILLNFKDDIYGFPSKLKEENILSLVKKSQHYPYEEERRLFYVALTRTKNQIYILVPKKNPSSFLKEIKSKKNVQKRYL